VRASYQFDVKQIRFWWSAGTQTRQHSLSTGFTNREDECLWLIDRIGAARVLTFFGLTMGTFVVLTGALGWITSTPEGLWIGLLVIRGLAGVCNAPLHPGAAHVVSDVMPVNRRATANGMITAGALIGIACCYPAFGWLMDSVTWQWAFASLDRSHPQPPPATPISDSSEAAVSVEPARPRIW
jgi:hypothetical protein